MVRRVYLHGRRLSLGRLQQGRPRMPRIEDRLCGRIAPSGTFFGRARRPQQQHPGFGTMHLQRVRRIDRVGQAVARQIELRFAPRAPLSVCFLAGYVLGDASRMGTWPPVWLVVAHAVPVSIRMSKSTNVPMCWPRRTPKLADKWGQ